MNGFFHPKQNRAHGLCFSVLPGVRTPPSLVNIYKEMEADLGLPRAATGDLTPWARQGVLLLNNTLTVEAGQAGSHAGRGWDAITDAAVAAVAAVAAAIVKTAMRARQAKTTPRPMVSHRPKRF